MINNLEYVISSSGDLIENLLESIEEYFNKDIIKDIDYENAIAEYVDVLKDGLFFLIEYPYVDKVYRNSFYTYYASKHSAYQRDCIRISIFSEEITRDDFLAQKNHENLKSKFLGYFVLRPIKAIFGRSVISPLAFGDTDFKICTHKSECSVFGVKFQTCGFPHSSQDGETISCAETTVWALMEYFGTRYPEYKPVLPSIIIKALEGLAMERQLPTNGLTMDQISYVLMQFGFGTRIYSKLQYKSELFEVIDTYVESGIPVMTGLESKIGELGHVVILIGKQYDVLNFKSIKAKKFEAFGRTVSYYDSSQFSNKYVVQDDNLAPYRLINLNIPGAHYEDAESKSYVIDTIVVPLYPKIYLEAYVAKNLILEIIKDSLLGYDFGNNFVFRFFLASSRSFKNHISNSLMGDQLKSNVLLLKMPKFIWVGEIYSKENYKPEIGEASGIIVLDATEANNTSADTLIFAAYPNSFISLNVNKFVTLPLNLKNYTYYSNLK